MKNIKFLFLLVATLCASAFTACQQEWEPGQPDSEMCVYFPVDVDVAAFLAVESDDIIEIDGEPIAKHLVATFPVYRQNKGAEMTVEIRSRFLDPTQVVSGQNTVADAFTVAQSVTFEEGENVAYLYILRDEAISLKVGELYDMEIMIKDTMHQGNYGLSRKTLGVGIPETWTELGLGTYTEDFFTWLYGVSGGSTVSVTIEESDSRPGMYRMKNLFSQDNVVMLLGGIPSDMQFASGNTYIQINAMNPDQVYFPFQYTGIGIPGYMDQFWIASGPVIGADYAKLVDGEIAFAAKTVGLFDASGTSGYYANQEGLMRITLPGVTTFDRTFAVAHSGTEVSADNSETRAYFDFTTGEDVTKYRFVIVDGNADIYVKKGSGLNQTTELHPAVAALLETTYTDGAPELTEDMDETIKAYLENSAESAASSTTWYISMPEAGLYTMLAVPYGPTEDGEIVSHIDHAAKALFYFNPANQGGVTVPDLTSFNLKLDSVANVMGNPAYEAQYPASFVLAFDMQSDEADLVTKIAWYYTKTADIPEGIDATTQEGMIALMAKAGADSDISSQISDLKAGKSPLLINSKPDTAYTVVVAVTTLYGKTHYYSISGATASYNFPYAYGTFKFESGDSKMAINFEPFFNSNYGLMFYMNWVVEDKAGEIEIRNYPMIAFTEPDYNAIVCYGQVNGYSGSFFAHDFAWYDYNAEKDAMVKNPDKIWGFHSSSQSFDYPMHYDYEAMVLKYNPDTGVITSLETNFRKYIKDFSGEDVVVMYENFDPAKTVITPADDVYFPPVVEETPGDDQNEPENGEENEPENGDQNEPENGEENGNEANPAKMGACKSRKPAMLQIKKDLNAETLSIK